MGAVISGADENPRFEGVRGIPSVAAVKSWELVQKKKRCEADKGEGCCRWCNSLFGCENNETTRKSE